MEDKEKSKEQLTEELAQLRRRVAELEASETELKRAEEALQKTRGELERRVEERTAELSKTNTLLEQKIAERKQAVEELQKREKRFRDIAEHSFDWIWEVDADGKYTYASPVVEDILGYTPKEVLDKHFYDLFHPEDREDLKRGAFEAFAKKQPFRELINRNVHKNGKTIWLSTSGVPILDENGALLGYRGADSDITERKLSEERIEHLNLVLHAIRNVNQLITKEKDRDRLIQSACELLIENRGYYNVWISLLDESGGIAATAEAGLGKDFLPMAETLKRGNFPECSVKALRRSEVVAIEERTSDCADCPLSHLPADSGRMAIRLEYGGNIYGLMNTSLPSHLITNKEEGDLFEEVAGDIAFALYSIEQEEKRKRADLELKEHRNHLEELVERRTQELKKIQEKLIASERLAVLGQFSGNVAHEIRNPLGVISSSAYFLKRVIKDDDEKVRTHLDQIQKQVVSCAKIIESILNLTRMKAPRLAPLNLLDIVLSEFVTVDVPAYITLKWNLPERPIPIMGDKAQLILVFNNIIKNAVQVMVDGGTLSVDAETVSEDGKSWVQIQLSDTGPGIEPANMERIFQPLFTTKTQGIGFGLSIAKLIIERHSGIISVESKLGEGATFVIRLPLAEE